MPVIVAPANVGDALVATDCKVPLPFRVATLADKEELAITKLAVRVACELLIEFILAVAFVILVEKEPLSVTKLFILVFIDELVSPLKLPLNILADISLNPITFFELSTTTPALAETAPAVIPISAAPTVPRAINVASPINTPKKVVASAGADAKVIVEPLTVNAVPGS